MLNKKASLLIITEPFPNINNSFLGTFVVNQINELTKTYNVVVITPFAPSIYNLFIKHQQKKIHNGNLTVYYIRYYPLWMVGLRILRLISASTLCFFNKRYSSKKIIKLAVKINNKYKFDLVHGHEVYIGDEAVRVGETLNIPTIFTLHGLYLYHLKCFGQKVIDLAMNNLKRFNQLISVSKTAANSYLINGLDRADIEIIPNGTIPQHGSKPSDEILSFTNNKTVLLTIGFFVPEKRINQSIEALSNLKLSGYRDIVLLIVGTGKLESKLKSLVKKLNLTDSVLFTGQISPEQMSSIYSVTNILVHPSIVDSFSMVCLEAMSYGIPIICTKNIGLVEYIHPGHDSIVIEPDSQTQLQNAIKKLIENPNLRAIISQQGKLTAQTLTSSQQVLKIKNIYEKYIH